MEAEAARRSSRFYSDGLLDGAVPRAMESDAVATIPTSSSASSFSSSSSDSPPRVNYIDHRVSKMDTLAGVAIKYGVEVADIKRLNGLMTDMQMFAHKSLQIPRTGRHLPSSCLSNDSVANGNCYREHTPNHRPSTDVLDLFHSINLKTPPSKVSPATNSLQAYYSHTPPKRGPVLEGTEMAVYRTGDCCLDVELLSTEPPFSDPLPGRPPRSASLINGFSQENGEISKEKAISENTETNEIEKPIRRRQKNDASLSLGTSELLLEEDNSSGFSVRKGKCPVMRPKLGSRTDMDMGGPNAIPNGDSSMADGFASVRKSCSTSSLQDSENSSSIWQTSKWTLKPEVLARPLFDGLPSLPNPITAWKNKAALD